MRISVLHDTRALFYAVFPTVLLFAALVVLASFKFSYKSDIQASKGELLAIRSAVSNDVDRLYSIATILAGVQRSLVSNALPASVSVGSSSSSPSYRLFSASLSGYQKGADFASIICNGREFHLGEKITPFIWVSEISENYILLSDGSCYCDSSLFGGGESDAETEKPEGGKK